MIARIAGQSDNHSDSGRFKVLHRHRAAEPPNSESMRLATRAPMPRSPSHVIASPTEKRRKTPRDPWRAGDPVDSHEYKKRAPMRATEKSRLNGESNLLPKAPLFEC